MNTLSSAPLILVVGMHRSGTSLLGALLQELGVQAPGPLIAGDPHNPEGYLEREDVTAIQEQLLIDLGRWWPSAAGLEPLPEGWLSHPATARARAALHTLLHHESQRQQAAWLIKDPRSSLLLPLWRELAQELSIPLQLVLAIRDPREVGVSLCRRDAYLAGMTAERAQRLWWLHNRQVLLDGQELPLLVVDYGRWFTSSGSAQTQLQQLQNALGLDPDPVATARALGRINPNYRRSRSRFSLIRGMQRFHRRLQALSHHPQQKRRSALVEQLRQPQGLRPLVLPEQPHPTIDVGTWFDPEHYQQQRPDLQAHSNLLDHYLNHGWRENPNLEPHPLFHPAHYRHEAACNGTACDGNPLLHFLHHGLQQGWAPSPLVDPLWVQQRGWSLNPHQPLRLARLHPWGAAAEALAPGNAPAARALLHTWLQRGFQPSELDQIASCGTWPLEQQPLVHLEPTPALQSPLFCRGSDPLHWPWHAWQEHLPEHCDGLNLLDLAGGDPACQHLLELSHRHRVADPQPERVALLQRLGVAAVPCNVQATRSSPASATLLDLASSELGLPAPSALADLGTTLVLGSGGDHFDRQLQAPILGLPGFDALQLATVEQAEALAAWLQDCSRLGLTLLRLNPAQSEPMPWPWPVQIFRDPLDPAALAEELAWRREGCPTPCPPLTPQPVPRVLWSHDSSQSPEAAIVISLYNYSDRIESALESAASQTLQPLELIVVDDASSDDGPETVQRWLQNHGGRFARARLLQHPSNAGLAAARNSAFATAASPWCFVLDADNTLAPTAVAHTLALANASPPSTAVVFPLVERCINGPQGPSCDGLISRVSWQTQHFLRGNVIDAMALIRRQAWQHVGGYCHIPGGWEDFDFWCSLIDAGWHGVLCPEQLATYHVHSQSMLQQQTNRHVRQVSRLLQARHPWLQLPMARPDC